MTDPDVCITATNLLLSLVPKKKRDQLQQQLSQNAQLRDALIGLGFRSTASQPEINTDAAPKRMVESKKAASKQRTQADSIRAESRSAPKAHAGKKIGNKAKAKIVASKKTSGAPSSVPKFATLLNPNFQPVTDEQRQRRRLALAAIYDQKMVEQPRSSSLREVDNSELLAMWKRLARIVAAPVELNLSTNMPDVIRRLDEIEAEWDKRSNEEQALGNPFVWPMSAVPSDGTVNSLNLNDESYLGLLGYSVAANLALTDRGRQALLAQIFKMRLPPLNSYRYRLGWGLPGTAQRLEKMADNIAASIALRDGARTRFKVAIEKWRGDLAFLHERFYVCHFSFPWPPC